MKRRKIIKLTNRNGFKIGLRKLKNPKKWILISDKDSKFALDYCRYIIDDNDKIIAIDPVGGPYITKGYQVFFGEEQYEVTDINLENILTLEPVEHGLN